MGNTVSLRCPRGPLDVTLKLNYQQVNAFVATTPYTAEAAPLTSSMEGHAPSRGLAWEG